jgi:hypothetical protein
MMMAKTRVLFALVAALASGCHPVLKLDLPKLPKVCADGWPVKLLLDPHCDEGVCGWTCAPDRWRTFTVC